MENRVPWILVGVLAFVISSAMSFYPEYYVDDLCREGNETIVYEVNAAGSLKASSLPPYGANKNCTLVLRPPLDRGIVLSVRKIDMREWRLRCTDYIKIFHSDPFTSPTMLCKFKFDLDENISFFTKGPMTLVYHVGPSDYPPLRYEEGFTLTFTVAATDLQDCVKDDMFMCGNGRCILKDMTCDGRNNCGDRSDESHVICDANVVPLSSVTDVLYIAVLVLLLLSLLSTCVFIVSRRRRRSALDPDSDSDEPTTRLTPFQAVHPNGFGICQNPAGPAYGPKVVHLDGGFSNPCYPSGAPPPPSYSN